MIPRLSFHLKTAVVVLASAWCLASGAEARRIVFVGDSITGQGGGWKDMGYVFKMRAALAAAHPDEIFELVPLGGSGMGVGSWLGLAKEEKNQHHELDVKGIEVAAELAKPADTLVVMLGMNDVLAPYVKETDESLDQWAAQYRELITLLTARLKPRIVGLATITPQTESPETPKNRVMARMNERIKKLAEEMHARLLPTNSTYWEVLTEGRKTQADFSLAGDRIHPSGTGHDAIAVGMLTGLGDDKAARWLREEKLAKALSALQSRPAPASPPPWLVASGLVLHAWQDKPTAADLAPNPIDTAIEAGGEFWKAPARDGAAPLQWQTFQPSIALTDGANPDSVDFAGITFGQNFEAGYAARWIKSPTARRLQLEIKTSGVGSIIYLDVWLNGQRHYSNLITSEPKRQATREVELRAGWNVLVVKSSHRAWQWQHSVALKELDGSALSGLEYQATKPE